MLTDKVVNTILQGSYVSFFLQWGKAGILQVHPARQASCKTVGGAERAFLHPAMGHLPIMFVVTKLVH